MRTLSIPMKQKGGRHKVGRHEEALLDSSDFRLFPLYRNPFKSQSPEERDTTHGNRSEEALRDSIVVGNDYVRKNIAKRVISVY